MEAETVEVRVAVVELAGPERKGGGPTPDNFPSVESFDASPASVSRWRKMARHREEAAARLAHRLGEDVALQAEAAAFVVLHLSEPFGSVSRGKFEELTGRPLDEAVAEIRPAVGRIMELEDEALTADPAYRKIMGLED